VSTKRGLEIVPGTMLWRVKMSRVFSRVARYWFRADWQWSLLPKANSVLSSHDGREGPCHRISYLFYDLAFFVPANRDSPEIGGSGHPFLGGSAYFEGMERSFAEQILRGRVVSLPGKDGSLPTSCVYYRVKFWHGGRRTLVWL